MFAAFDHHGSADRQRNLSEVKILRLHSKRVPDGESNGKRRPAAAGTGRIRILHHESGTDQLVREINDGIGKEWQGHAVDQHLLTVLFQHRIVGCCVIQPDVILKPRTTAAFDRNAQGLCGTCLFRNLGQARKGTVGDARG